MTRNQIRERATETLTAFAVDPGGAWEEISPEIYFVSTDDIGDDTLSELELKLLDYYMRNKKDFPLEKVCHFTSGEWEAYFFSRAAGRIGERTAAAIMVVVVLVLSVLLYCVQRYTVKVLDSKDKSMKDFFANASHELKTPLMAIRSYAEGLESGLVEQDKACDVITKEADRITSLVNAILEFSKLDSGTVQSNMSKNDVREILHDAIQAIEQTAEQKGIIVVPELPDPMLFTCDEDMLFPPFPTF